MRKAANAVLACAAATILTLPTLALADSISPSSYSGTLAVGESTTIHKTVTVNKEATTSKLDVFFLADTTGSMGSAIYNVKANASSILSSLSSYGDVQFGVGEYKDFDGDPYAFRVNTGLTSSGASAQSGISMWGAGGGADWEEANLYALTNVATATSWRAGSQRIVVWFGDAPGHDPSGGATLGSTTNALTSNGIKVEAIDVGYMNSNGQASSIASATGGNYFNDVDASAVSSTILGSIKETISHYTNVALGLGDVPEGLSVTATGAYTGDFDRSIDRTFDFDITFTAKELGSYDFDIDALVDGGIVGIERDHIDVGTVPEPSTMFLLATGLLGLGAIRRKARK